MTPLELAHARAEAHGHWIGPPPVKLHVTDRFFRWMPVPVWRRFDGFALTRNRIFVRTAHANDVGLIAHELVHVHQMRRLGGLRFAWEYWLENRRVGYRRNRFEVEARMVQHTIA